LNYTIRIKKDYMSESDKLAGLLGSAYLLKKADDRIDLIERKLSEIIKEVKNMQKDNQRMQKDNLRAIDENKRLLKELKQKIR